MYMTPNHAVASGIRCKSAGVVPGFMIRLGDGADSFAGVGWLAGGDGAWPELAGWGEQGAAQGLEQPQAVPGHGEAAPAAGRAGGDRPDQGWARGLPGGTAQTLEPC